MADDKSKTGGQDRDRVSGSQDYEVEYIAKEARISQERARELIRTHGPDRQKVLEAARRG
jgi:hypothetical protein